MGEKTGSRCKIDSIPFCIAHVRRMSQFETLIRSRYSPLIMKTLILVVFIDATMPMPELINSLVKNVPCKHKKREIIFLIFLILIICPGYTSLFLETLRRKFWGNGGEHMGQKQVPS